MADENGINKIFVTLTSSGLIKLDHDQLSGNYDRPSINPDIELDPISITELAMLTAELFLDDPEPEGVAALKTLKTELKTATDIIENAVVEAESKAKN